MNGDGQMEATLAVAADYANVSNEGKLNIMGVFSEVNPTELPAALQQMFLVLVWEAGAAEFGTGKQIRIAFVGEDGEVQINLDLPEVTVPQPARPGSRVNFNQIIGMGGLPIQQVGAHAFLILVGGEEKTRIPLYVSELPTGGEG